MTNPWKTMAAAFIAAVFALGALFVPATCASCASPSVAAREKVALPALRHVWPGVREDAEFGADRTPAPDVSRAAIGAFAVAVDAGDVVALSVGWPAVHASAVAGIDRRLAEGGIGPTGATVLRDRAEQCGALVAILNAGGSVR